MLLFVFLFSFFLQFFSCAPSIADTYGTSTGGRMARYIATSCIFTGRRSFFTAGKHTRDWHRTFHSYQTCYDNTTKNFCYFAWTIRGKSLYEWSHHSTQCGVWNRAGKWEPKYFILFLLTFQPVMRCTAHIDVLFIRHAKFIYILNLCECVNVLMFLCRFRRCFDVYMKPRQCCDVAIKLKSVRMLSLARWRFDAINWHIFIKMQNEVWNSGISLKSACDRRRRYNLFTVVENFDSGNTWLKMIHTKCVTTVRLV